MHLGGGKLRHFANALSLPSFGAVYRVEILLNLFDIGYFYERLSELID